MKDKTLLGFWEGGVFLFGASIGLFFGFDGENIGTREIFGAFVLLLAIIFLISSWKIRKILKQKFSDA